MPATRPYLLPLLLLSSFAANSQATNKLPLRPVCFTLAEAERLRDSLFHLPTVRREALEWHQAYRSERMRADTNAYAAKQHRLGELYWQKAFSGQQLLLNDVRQEKDKFKRRAHRKGWAILTLLAGFASYVYLTH